MSEARGQIRKRSIGVVFADGGMLAIGAVRPEGARGHDDEIVSAVIRGPDGALVEIDEALVSTEYDESGLQRRATLEMWPDPDAGQPLRGAGISLGATRKRVGDVEISIAFFNWSVEGREGVGQYEIVRHA